MHEYSSYNNFLFKILDKLFLRFFFKIFGDKKNIKIKFRFINNINLYNYMPYVKFYKNLTNKNFFFKNQYLNGFRFLWKGLSLWILPLFICLLAIYFMLSLRLVYFPVVLFQWFALLMFLYWLISGFVFFIKKYRFSRYTSAIQRFWRRSYILFWLIESCLLVVFIYLTLNAAQESIYVLDQIQIFKTHLLSLNTFLYKNFLYSFLIIFTYFYLISLKWNINQKHITYIIIITLILTHFLWLEFYQIFHVSNFYSNLFWTYDVDDQMWSLETDVRRTRIVNHYVMILFILKFWHIVFIYGFWIFFILRVLELNRSRYPLLSANFQNFIILYVMTLILIYPWIKFGLKKFFEDPYFWFYQNNHTVAWRVFYQDVLNLFVSDFFFSKNFNFDFFYWNVKEGTGFASFRKHSLKNIILSSL